MSKPRVRKCARLPGGKGFICRKPAPREEEGPEAGEQSGAPPEDGTPGPELMAKKLVEEVESWRRRRRAG